MTKRIISLVAMIYSGLAAGEATISANAAVGDADSGPDYTNNGKDWTAGICQTGSHQSPIALAKTFTTECAGPAISVVDNEVSAQLVYGESGIVASSRNLGLELDLSKDACKRLPDSLPTDKIGTLYLDSFHFHSLAEHLVDVSDSNPTNPTLRLDAELHLVFTDEYHLPKAVLGYILDQRDNKASPFIDSLMKALPNSAKAGIAEIDWDASGLLQANSFHTYNGSLTTPGCSEPIVWFVGKTSMSTKQAEWFKILRTKYAQGNYRVQQDVGNRLVPKLKMNVSHQPAHTSDVGKYATAVIAVVAVAVLALV